MAKVYLISDLHIGHTGIHEKWRKDFCSQSDHDETMVDAWNTVVRGGDIVKVLGDFIMGQEALKYLHHLNGQIHWFLGNHDVKITRHIMEEYKNVSYCAGIMAYKGAVLSHVPVHPGELSEEYRSWNFNIHGHIHAPEKNQAVTDDPKYYNVNADIMGYFPREFHSIMRECGKE